MGGLGGEGDWGLGVVMSAVLVKSLGLEALIIDLTLLCALHTCYRVLEKMSYDFAKCIPVFV